MESKRVHIIVKGRVQGVFFRANTQNIAVKNELTGWVRNRPDGTVEIVAEGTNCNLRTFVNWCRKGPPGAIVSDVDVTYSNASGEFSSFSISY